MKDNMATQFLNDAFVRRYGTYLVLTAGKSTVKNKTSDGVFLYTFNDGSSIKTDSKLSFMEASK